jgi:dephospho-CoA kinase
MKQEKTEKTQWEELVERQSKEYAEHIESVKTSREKLLANKEAVLAASKCTEAELPRAVRDMLKENEEGWRKEFGMYGTQFKNLRLRQEKELNKFFYREAKAQELAKPNDKTKDKSAGR